MRLSGTKVSETEDELCLDMIPEDLLVDETLAEARKPFPKAGETMADSATED
jgi:hypothetical protein